MFNLGDAYQSLFSSPFSKEISSIDLSSKFNLPKFKLYDRMIDPTRHVLHYKQQMKTTMISDSKKDVVMCKVFASSLSSLTLVGLVNYPCV